MSIIIVITFCFIGIFVFLFMRNYGFLLTEYNLQRKLRIQQLCHEISDSIKKKQYEVHFLEKAITELKAIHDFHILQQEKEINNFPNKQQEILLALQKNYFLIKKGRKKLLINKLISEMVQTIKPLNHLKIYNL